MDYLQVRSPILFLMALCIRTPLQYSPLKLHFKTSSVQHQRIRSLLSFN